MKLSIQVRLALSGLSGLAYTLLFPPFDGTVLAWFGFVPLLIAIVGARPAVAAGCGIAWAFSATLGVAWWIPGMLSGYFAVPVWGGWLGWLGVAVFVMSWPYALFGWVVAAGVRRGLAGPLSIGLAFASAEWLRARGPLGSPFAQLGYSQLETPFAQTADLVGTYGVAALVIAVNAVLASILVPAIAGHHKQLSRLATAAVFIAAFAYGEHRLGQDFGEGASTRIALVQGAVARELRWDPRQRGANLDRYLSLTEQAVARTPDVVLWPEFAVDFYLAEATRERARLLDGVRDAGVELVLGGSHYEPSQQEVAYFNSVFVIDSLGRLRTDRYDKQKLIPFAEYGPFGDRFRAETAVYSAGDDPKLLAVGDLLLGPFLCGEALFAEVARQMTRAGATVLVNPSNDYWFGEPAAAEHQLQVAAFRAIENRRYLARPTSTGVSALIDPQGRTLARSQGGGAEVIHGTVRPSHAVTVYQKFGDAPLVSCAFVVTGLAFRRRGVSPNGTGEQKCNETC